MYSTKLVNSKQFQGSYISIGDEYDKQSQLVNSRHKGKQFITNPPARGHVQGDLFKYHSEPYEDETVSYRVTQPVGSRNKGFGSGDASRRDEFGNRIRQAQWKETVRTEKTNELKWHKANTEVMEKLRDSIKETKPEDYSSNPLYFQTRIPKHLYDIGHTPEGTTPICMKCSRDTFYCKHRVGNHKAKSARREGDYRWKSTSRVIGSRVKNVAPKTVYGKGHNTMQFFDISHLGE